MSLGDRLVISMGDPAGISPEIILKAAQAGYQDKVIVVGDTNVLQREQARLNRELAITRIDHPHQANKLGCLYVIDNGIDHSGLVLGEASVCGGASAFASLNKAIDYAISGEVSALVTAPLNKYALGLAGVPYVGHTEILAERAGGVPVSMALVNDDLKVLLVTCHQSLRSIFDSLTRSSLRQAFHHALLLLKAYGYQAPRIAVAGLNPHAGEGGMFGDEEQTTIMPAIEAAQVEGIPVTGPYPPDTVFMRARDGEFDLVIALYHDQGLIPVKYLGLDHGVNITVGLPFVRTSPDHGTAYDRVGEGTASPLSLLAALKQADILALTKD